MTDRSSPRAAVPSASNDNARANNSSSKCSTGIGTSACQTVFSAAGLPASSRPGTAAAAAADSIDSVIADSDAAAADVLESASTELDYRSAHLRSFMEAVRAAAQCRGTGSGKGLDVPLGNTLIAVGAARR
jgi:hypothetical protein